VTVATVDPTDAVQVGIRAVLLADAALVALLADAESVWDEPPEEALFPYVHIGEVTSISDGTHSAQGRQVVPTIHTWAKARSARPVNEIGARVVAVLDLQEAALDAAVTGVTVWMVLHEFSQTLRDPDRTIRHRIDRFRIYTSQD
jgi:hypothetical protein